MSIRTSGDNLYLGDWDIDPLPDQATGSVQKYDITDSRYPALLDRLDTPEQEVQQLALDDTHLFVANDKLGLSVFDLTSPAHMTLQMQQSDGLYARTVALTDVMTVGDGDEPPHPERYVLTGYLYYGGLAVYHYPAARGSYQATDLPSFSKSYVTAAIGPQQHVIAVVARGPLAYVLFAEGGSHNAYLEVLDLSTLPNYPTPVGGLLLPCREHGDIGEIRLLGDFVMLAASELRISGTVVHPGGLRVIDVADPSHPILAASLDLPHAGFIDWIGAGLDVATDRVYLASEDGLHVVDVADPRLPVHLAAYAWPASFGQCQGGVVTLMGDLAFAGGFCRPTASSRGGLAVYRIR